MKHLFQRNRRSNAWFRKRISLGKKQRLTETEHRALNIGAILTNSSFNDQESLENKRCFLRIRAMRKKVRREWGISSESEALEALEYLMKIGHRELQRLVLAAAPDSFEDGFTFRRFLETHRLAGVPLTGAFFMQEHKERLPDYAKPFNLHSLGALMPVAEKSMYRLYDMYIEMSLMGGVGLADIAEKYRILLGLSQDEYIICNLVFRLLDDKFGNFLSCANNLKRHADDGTLQEILGTDITQGFGALRDIDTAAWDMGRMVDVAKWCYTLGYISKEQAWKYVFFAYETCLPLYCCYADYSRAYMVGRMLWSDANQEAKLEKIKARLSDIKSPWLKLDWGSATAKRWGHVGSFEQNHAEGIARLVHLKKWPEATAQALRLREYAKLHGNHPKLQLYYAIGLVNLTAKKESEEAGEAKKIADELGLVSMLNYDSVSHARAHAMGIFNLYFAKEQPETEKAEKLLRPLFERFESHDDIATLYSEVLSRLDKGDGKRALHKRTKKLDTHTLLR